MEILKNTKKIISDEDDEEVVVDNKTTATNNDNNLSLKEDNKLNQDSKASKPANTETPNKSSNLSNGNKVASDILAKIKNQYKNANTNSNSMPNTNEKEKNKPQNFLNKKKERETKKVIVDEESSSSFTEEETEEEYYDEKKVKESLVSSTKVNKEKKSVKASVTNTVKSTNKASVQNKKPQSSAIKNKDGLVYEILKRWWYVIDIDWYKIDEDVNEVLKRKGLRQIDLSEWKMQEDMVNGLKKCVELKGFPLVFLDCDEQYHDLRNKQNCPSFNNLVKKVRI